VVAAYDAEVLGGRNADAMLSFIFVIRRLEETGEKRGIETEKLRKYEAKKKESMKRSWKRKK
jgi:hypothetical protein